MVGPRRRSREVALQILHQIDVGGDPHLEPGQMISRYFAHLASENAPVSDDDAARRRGHPRRSQAGRRAGAGRLRSPRRDRRPPDGPVAQLAARADGDRRAQRHPHRALRAQPRAQRRRPRSSSTRRSSSASATARRKGSPSSTASSTAPPPSSAARRESPCREQGRGLWRPRWADKFRHPRWTTLNASEIWPISSPTASSRSGSRGTTFSSIVSTARSRRSATSAATSAGRSATTR